METHFHVTKFPRKYNFQWRYEEPVLCGENIVQFNVVSV